jgi:hypothetical protein
MCIRDSHPCLHISSHLLKAEALLEKANLLIEMYVHLRRKK